jgi:hypothetical protein
MALHPESPPQPSYQLRLRRVEEKADRDEVGR